MISPSVDLRLDEELALHLDCDREPLAIARLRIWRGESDLLRSAVLERLALSSDGASADYYLKNKDRLRITFKAEAIRGQDVPRLTWAVTNTGVEPIVFDRIAAPELRLNRKAFSTNKRLWSMQGPAVKWGQDFAFSLPEQFSRDNYLGHLQDGEGGGIPIVYFWDDRHGLALMHMDPKPRDWHMPVTAGGQSVTAALELRQRVELHPGESLMSLAVVLSSHHGDFFQPVALYRDLLAGQGVRSPEPASADYEPAWCSWGYEFDVRPEEMTGVLPKLREMGIRWLTLDDRWFDAYGDWNPRRDTFPHGVDDIRRMNAVIHDSGAFSTLWWYPLCVEDGHGRWESHSYASATLFLEHPDWLVHNADGTVARNNRHLAMLCPALPAVQESIAALTRRFIADWGFDGHKLDNIYTMPACYNPGHNHIRPEESTEAMAEAYRIIFTLTRELKPYSVTQICPCGTPITAPLLPFTDQTVTADPTSSAQIRQRIKFYKALVGPRAAVFADHVELSDGGIDFASEIGTGGVPGTKFVWPEAPNLKARLREYWSLTPQKDELFKKWFQLYQDHRLAAGEYLDLYDLAFDRPEAHAIAQGHVLYYAFFAEVADPHYTGSISLRGLREHTYRIMDYANGRDFGLVNGPGEVSLDVSFMGALLLAALPG
jgi:alpha-galactosidase